MKLPRWLNWLMKHISVDPKPGGGVVNVQWEGDIGGKKLKDDEDGKR